MYNYSKTPSFQDLQKRVNHLTNFLCVENDEVVYAKNPLPSVVLIGTVKLHGTNAGFGYNVANDECWFQSKSQKVKDGHFGFPTAVNEDELKKIAKYVSGQNTCDTVMLYGEWAGKGIQKGVAISNIDKAFYIFAIKLIKGDNEVWISQMDMIDIAQKFHDPESNIRFIHNYICYVIDVDFNKPKVAFDSMKKWVDDVEKECPVAKFHGESGTGEGVVFVGTLNGERLICKVKGEKHSVTGKADKPAIEADKLEKIFAFVDYAVTENRVKQAIFELDIKNPDKKDTGKVVKWVYNDVLEEELDNVGDFDLVWEDVSGFINKKTSAIFIKMTEYDYTRTT